MGALNGKVAVVTGAGRRRGIGRAIALRLAQDGADVCASAVRREPDSFPEHEREAGWQGIESVAEEVRALGRRGPDLVRTQSHVGLSGPPPADRGGGVVGGAGAGAGGAAAGPGWAAEQYLWRLQTTALALEPDLVLLTLFSNEPSDLMWQRLTLGDDRLPRRIQSNRRMIDQRGRMHYVNDEGLTLPQVAFPGKGLLEDHSFTLIGLDREGQVLSADIVTPVVSPGEEIPNFFTLYGNYPNPFNPSTTIRLDLPETVDVAVEVFDVLMGELEKPE